MLTGCSSPNRDDACTALNGYPGPAHVLAMATELDLSPDQKQHTGAVFISTESKVTGLGRALIVQEREPTGSLLNHVCQNGFDCGARRP